MLKRENKYNKCVIKDRHGHVHETHGDMISIH